MTRKPVVILRAKAVGTGHVWACPRVWLAGRPDRTRPSVRAARHVRPDAGRRDQTHLGVSGWPDAKTGHVSALNSPPCWRRLCRSWSVHLRADCIPWHHFRVSFHLRTDSALAEYGVHLRADSVLAEARVFVLIAFYCITLGFLSTSVLTASLQKLFFFCLQKRQSIVSQETQILIWMFTSALTASLQKLRCSPGFFSPPC